jgi:hypothetical protein
MARLGAAKVSTSSNDRSSAEPASLVTSVAAGLLAVTGTFPEELLRSASILAAIGGVTGVRM